MPRTAWIIALLATLLAAVRIGSTWRIFTETSDEGYRIACGMEWLAAGGAEEPHRAGRVVFLRLSFLASLWSEAMNSLCVENGPRTRPAATSAKPSAS